MRPFLVCLHDVTPAYDVETRRILRDLAPLVGRRLSLGVVPDWSGEWPLAAHPAYCELVGNAAEELLLHGYHHRRARGWGPVTLLAERSDEMNGLDRDETRDALARGQRVLRAAFGQPARGFLAPAWQLGHARRASTPDIGLQHHLGFFALESATGRRLPLATWSWDCGRWGWLGHIGHGVGGLLHAADRGVPTLAIHPRDLARGFWPTILRLTRGLLDAGYEPTTPTRLLEASGA